MDQQHTHRATYPPLNTLKHVGENIWIVDGPAIRFGIGGIKFPFPTRMTITRLAGRRLFVHSPTHLTEDLHEQVESLGKVAFIIAPNRIHYWWVPYWHASHPDAEVWLAPRVREQAGTHIDFHAEALSGETGYPWDEEIATLPIAGSYMTEFEFFHRLSRTLVLTDLIENFEPDKLGWFYGLLARLGGVSDPHGSMPRDMRFSFLKQRRALKAAVEAMISMNPERIIVSHGRWYERNGAEELQRAFRWLL
jgi:hypothetical protein